MRRRRDDDDGGEAAGNYLAEVERLFVERTRCGLNLSGRDVALVRQWQRGGVPLEVVARGLEAALQGWGERRPPRSLHFAREAVDEALARHRRLYPSPPPTAPAQTTPADPELAPLRRAGTSSLREPDELEALAGFLVALGQARREPHVREALREGYRELRRLAAAEPVPGALEAWREVRRRILEALHATLSSWQRAQLERVLAAEPFGTMSAAAAEAHRAAVTERWLAETLDLRVLASHQPPARPDASRSLTDDTP